MESILPVDHAVSFEAALVDPPHAGLYALEEFALIKNPYAGLGDNEHWNSQSNVLQKLFWGSVSL